MQLRGIFGPVQRIAKTKELIDQNYLSDIKVKAIVLKYSKEDCQYVRGMKYHDETTFLAFHDMRNRFIRNLTKHTKGNTLILFNLVEKHGTPLHEFLQKTLSNKHVEIVHGKIKNDVREDIRTMAESMEDLVICASFGTYQVGVNIPNIHNIILVAPTKSQIRLLQSVGRGLRKHDTKDYLTVYDIGDDLGQKNFSFKHLIQRVEIYQKEGFDIESIEYDLSGK